MSIVGTSGLVAAAPWARSCAKPSVRPRRGVVAAHDDAAGVEVVVERLALAQKLRAEDDVVGPELAAHVLGVAHRHRGLYHDGGLVLAPLGGVQHERDHVLHGARVEEVAPRVVVGGRGHDHVVGVRVGGGAVQRGGQAQLALAGLRLGQVALDVLVLDGGAPRVDGLDLLWHHVHRDHVVVLGEQHRERQAHVARARHGDPLAGQRPGRGGCRGVRVVEDVCGLEAERRGQREQLVHAGRVVGGLQAAEQRAVDARGLGELRLRHALLPAQVGDGLREPMLVEFLCHNVSCLLLLATNHPVCALPRRG